MPVRRKFETPSKAPVVICSVLVDPGNGLELDLDKQNCCSHTRTKQNRTMIKPRLSFLRNSSRCWYMYTTPRTLIKFNQPYRELRASFTHNQACDEI